MTCARKIVDPSLGRTYLLRGADNTGLPLQKSRPDSWFVIPRNRAARFVKAGLCSGFGGLLLGAAAIHAAKAPGAETGTDWQKLVLESPRPVYPLYARSYGFGAEGKYRTEIDEETGNVRSVTILKSTAHKVLDNAVISALRRWRFRPHALRAAVIPVHFILEGRPIDKTQRLAVYCVPPDLPVTWHHGSAIYRFIVDYETGKVTDVKVVKTSGLPEYDKAVVKAYRQWRFPPHKIHSIDESVIVKPDWY